MAKIHPAIAEHVMEENEKLRGLLEAALFYVPNAGLRSDISAALSQQAEPECGCCGQTGECDDDCDSRIFGRDAPVLAPAEPCEFHDSDQAACQQYSGQVPCESVPAQTEQQPSSAQQILDLIMEECRYWHGRDEARRGNFANLYAQAKEIADNAALIAQTAPQPEQSGLLEALERVKLTEKEARHHSVSAVAYWNNAVTACIAALTAQGGE